MPECHLWLAKSASIDGDLLGAYETLLCESERARLVDLRPSDRAEYLTTRALVRTTLSRYCSVEPHEWRFAPGPYGRPEVAFPSAADSISFNLSHSGGLVACVLSWNRQVGVDVEHVRERAVLDIADGVLAEAERDQLLALSGVDRTERFFALWTLKESYSKARGLGFALPPDTYHFGLDSSPMTFAAPSGDCAQSWQFSLLRPSPEHRMALAVQTSDGHPVTVIQRHTVPLGDHLTSASRVGSYDTGIHVSRSELPLSRDVGQAGRPAPPEPRCGAARIGDAGTRPALALPR